MNDAVRNSSIILTEKVRVQYAQILVRVNVFEINARKGSKYSVVFSICRCRMSETGGQISRFKKYIKKAFQNVINGQLNILYYKCCRNQSTVSHKPLIDTNIPVHPSIRLSVSNVSPAKRPRPRGRRRSRKTARPTRTCRSGGSKLVGILRRFQRLKRQSFHPHKLSENVYGKSNSQLENKIIIEYYKTFMEIIVVRWLASLTDDNARRVSTERADGAPLDAADLREAPLTVEVLGHHTDRQDALQEGDAEAAHLLVTGGGRRGGVRGRGQGVLRLDGGDGLSAEWLGSLAGLTIVDDAVAVVVGVGCGGVVAEATWGGEGFFGLLAGRTGRRGRRRRGSADEGVDMHGALVRRARQISRGLIEANAVNLRSVHSPPQFLYNGDRMEW